MSDGAISKEAMLAGLRDIRLPAEASGGFVSDLAAIVFLAACASLICVGLLRLFSSRRSIVLEPNAFLGSDSDTKDERRIALLRRLKAQSPDRFAALRETLYRPDHELDLATLEAEVQRNA
ncbi:hypothetical protein [Roseovarius aestuariivivens]|uniref:hypothetical protein n=1 Tax=Roseovarius aestuariivivens TaxID=1888910 RepID=UPI0010802D3B|nr:hypothetical protein [Roseovarius aestuariivivens]